MNQPLMQFDSHIAGKNAMVKLWPDRIEWSKTGWMGTGAKLALGAATAGVSLLATGVRGKGEANVILVRSVSSVSTRKAGLTKVDVDVATPAGVISFRCSSGEASRFQRLLLQQVANGGALPPTSSAPMPVPPAHPMQSQPEVQQDAYEQLERLGKLRESGVLSEEEFAAKKEEILRRI